MHSNPHADLTPSVIFGLGWLYLIQALMNLAWTCRSYKHDGDHRIPAAFGGGHVPYAMWWGLYTALLIMVSAAHFTGSGAADTFLISMPLAIRPAIDWLVMNAVRYFSITMLGFVAIILLRRLWATPTVGARPMNCLFFTRPRRPPGAPGQFLRYA